MNKVDPFASTVDEADAKAIEVNGFTQVTGILIQVKGEKLCLD